MGQHLNNQNKLLKMPKIFHALLLTTLTLSPAVLLTPAGGQAGIRKERIQFKRGASSAVVEDSITGYETVDYVLNAREGQYMNVSMATDNTINYFNILAPGENEVAMFNSSMAQNQYEGILSKSGDYKIRVYMMRSAARRNEVANYRLEMIVTGSGDRSGVSSNRVSGRRITIQFPRGSNCGSYGGRVNVGDTFLLNLTQGQQLIIKKNTPHDYSVQAPNGKYLEVIRRFPGDENQYWTGNQSGNFEVTVGSVPDGRQINIQFCAYTGEGE
ncbi:MAG: hypothetical protein AB4206_15335 [Xenococcaceae cyanobacterium]